VQVLRVNGRAERRTGEGRWTGVLQGDKLAVDDAVRTGGQSSITLDLGDSSTIELAEQAEVEVRELSGAVQKLGLISGRASVDYRDNGERVLNIENGDGTVVARVQKGRFAVLNNGQLLAVATKTGSVDLSSAGRTVVVSEGKQSVAYAGQTPMTPFEIPVDALLRIADGSCRIQKSGGAVVKGTVSVGARLSVDGQPVTPDGGGRFSIALKAAAPGKKVLIRETDLWGETRETQLTCATAAQKAGIREVDINWGRDG